MMTLTLAISGSGGAGAISTGELVLRLFAESGGYGMLKKTFSPQIRGGESAAIVRLGNAPVATIPARIDLLIALDWQNFARFADEVPVSARTLVLHTGSDDPPPGLTIDNLLTIDAAGIAAAADSGWLNMVLLGMLARGLGGTCAAAEALLLARLEKHDEAARDAACRALRAGFAEPLPEPLAQLLAALPAPAPAASAPPRWLASGNQMAALGALEAGVRFVAAYPITPASDLLEWLARHIEHYGGHLVQAEDELAAINMVIGAGFGGVPAMTATSGPGMALMSEAMGLAVASETAAVVVDVMRGGPSTGIPTKSEQSDLNLALYGLHGDAPHIVLAAQSIADCHFTTAWAVQLATRLQTLVIVLSDQSLGQSIQVFDAPGSELPRAVVEHAVPAEPYLRYRDTASGVSPLALPGEPGHMYTADGLEHGENAIPSPRSRDHRLQLDKRLRKLTGFDFGERWADLTGQVEGRSVIICMGSVTASALEARQSLARAGHEVAVLSLRLLAPLPLAQLGALLESASRLLVVEHNHGAQLWHYLRSLLPHCTFDSLALPGPAAIQPRDIFAALEIADVA
ncbi:MAG: 2-oxoacid:acceptor oxidoreductase subunit alpha [Haliea sp.]|uniref:2-oxoacid:acceptor oxidoreductase subunit alpha n=1 Tax=Haliea sp. TaxID=1932666 RepID=UPI0032EEAE1B